jgi:hypothetical protein
VRQQAILLVAAIDHAVPRFDVAVEGIDEGCDAVEVGQVIVALVSADDARVVDVVESGEERDVEIGEAERRGILCRHADCAAEDRIVCPDAVLQEQRVEADGERKVEAGIRPGKTGIERTRVAFEEKRLRIEIEFVVELAVAVAAAELETGEFLIGLLQRREERMDPFGAGDLEIDVEV